MKKIFKKEVIIAFIIGIILASSIAVYAYSYAAKDVSYTKPGTTTEINVETALNDLYNKKNNATLLWTNSNLSSFSGETIDLDLSSYDYIIIDGYYNNNTTGEMPKTIIKKGTSQCTPIGANYNSNKKLSVAQMRIVTVNNSGVVFEEQMDYNSNGESTYGIPYHIWGLKLNEF